jgi:hypothetical protein
LKKFNLLKTTFNLYDFQVSIDLGNGASNSNERGCFSQFKSLYFYQAIFAEILGTYLLVLYVCSFGIPVSDYSYQSINGCLGSGFIVSHKFLYKRMFDLS